MMKQMRPPPASWHDAMMADGDTGSYGVDTTGSGSGCLEPIGIGLSGPGSGCSVRSTEVYDDWTSGSSFLGQSGCCCDARSSCFSEPLH